MYMVYKDSTPTYIQVLLHKMARENVAGPTFHTHIDKSLSIVDATPIFPALDHLKNYNKNSIDLDRLDGMFCITYSPSDDSDIDKNLTDYLGIFFNERQVSTQPDIENMFDFSLSSHCAHCRQMIHR